MNPTYFALCCCLSLYTFGRNKIRGVAALILLQGLIRLASYKTCAKSRDAPEGICTSWVTGAFERRRRCVELEFGPELKLHARVTPPSSFSVKTIAELRQKWRGKKDIRKNEILAAACFPLCFSQGANFSRQPKSVAEGAKTTRSVLKSCVFPRRNERLPMKVALTKKKCGERVATFVLQTCTSIARSASKRKKLQLRGTQETHTSRTWSCRILSQVLPDLFLRSEATL